jgi:hypothetical protein
MFEKFSMLSCYRRPARLCSFQFLPCTLVTFDFCSMKDFGMFMVIDNWKEIWTLIYSFLLENGSRSKGREPNVFATITDTSSYLHIFARCCDLFSNTCQYYCYTLRPWTEHCFDQGSDDFSSPTSTLSVLYCINMKLAALSAAYFISRF